MVRPSTGCPAECRFPSIQPTGVLMKALMIHNTLDPVGLPFQIVPWVSSARFSSLQGNDWGTILVRPNYITGFGTLAASRHLPFPSSLLMPDWEVTTLNMHLSDLVLISSDGDAVGLRDGLM